MSSELTTTEKLKNIRDAVLALTASPLYEYRVSNGYLPVLGEGSHTAQVVFVGEAPGEKEAKSGRPFVGAAGKVLTGLLEGVGVSREDVYIANLVKDRPPQNRDPLPEEIALYGPFLLQQLEVIRPTVVATLGRFSLQYILSQFGAPEAGQTISSLHGVLIHVQAAWGEFTVMPLYHPAAALYNPSLRVVEQEDMQKVFDILKRT